MMTMAVEMIYDDSHPEMETQRTMGQESDQNELSTDDNDNYNNYLIIISLKY